MINPFGEIPAMFEDSFGREEIILRAFGLEFETVIRGHICAIDSDFDAIWIRQDPFPAGDFPFHLKEGYIWEFSLTMTFPFRLGPEMDRMGQLVIQSRKFGDSKKQPWELFLQVGVNGSTLLELGAGWDLEKGLNLVFEKLPDDLKPRCCLFCQHIRDDFDNSGQGWFCREIRCCVPELHWCDRFQPRIPGTGYRG